MEQLNLDVGELQPTTFETLLEAKQYVEAGREDGVDCPCCGKLVKSYDRKLNATMAAGLIWLVKMYEEVQAWVDVANDAPRELVRSNQIGTLKHWGLVKSGDSNSGKRNSGFWIPTQKGIDFAHNRIRVESHATIADDNCIGLTGSLTIGDALKNKFSYPDLMGASI